MTVSNILSRWSYTANGVTTVFAYANRIFADTDLKVYVDGALKALTTDYMVSGIDNPGGGNVTFGVAPANSASVVIVRDVPATQPVDYQANDPFPAEIHEKALDRVTIIAQQAIDKATRAFRLQDSDPTMEILLPAKSLRAGKYLAFDANGDPSVATEIDPGNVQISTYMETLLDDADAAAARATLGVSAASDSAAGLAEIATQVEVDAETDDARYVTPKKLAAYAPARRASFRNRIINGAMRLDQRFNGSANISGGSNVYTLDRWATTASGTQLVLTIQRVTDAPANSGLAFSLKVTVSTAETSISAGDYGLIRQRIEGRNIADLLWGTAAAKGITLGFWVRASVAGWYHVAFQNAANNRRYIAPYSIDVANTWEFKTITIAGDTSGTWDTADDVGIAVIWSFGAGSTFESSTGSWGAGAQFYGSSDVDLIGTLNATFQLAGVQLETGSVATEFEHRPWPVELLLCQRYFSKTFPLATAVAQNAGGNGSLKSFGHAAGSVNSNGVTWQFPTRMRVTPTIMTYNPSAANSGWRFSDATDTAAATEDACDSSVNIYNSASTPSKSGYQCRIHATADAEL